MRSLRPILLSCFFLIAASAAAQAQTRQQRTPPAAPPTTESTTVTVKATETPTLSSDYSIVLPPSVTHQSVMLHGKPLEYEATAAQIPIRDEAGEVECRMFYVSYIKGDPKNTNRPVTFAFNGGPGSASMWVHMGALGPKRAPMNDDGSLPKPPYHTVTNEETWLDFTDVVCVDAPATGFSRVTKRELNGKYFGVDQDINAFSAFVRNWLKENKRWGSPVFIAGESYGGIRGSGLSANLFDAGVAVSGFVSISGTSNYMTISGQRGNDTTYIGFVPSMAACAWYHNKVSHQKYKEVGPFVEEVRKWTDTVYGPALALGDSLPPAQEDKIAEQLASYLGITKKYCLGSNLRVTEFAFFSELLRDEGLTIGRYDGRLVGKNETHYGRGGGDPSNEAVTPPFVSAINAYLFDELGVRTNMSYLPRGNVYPWHEDEGQYAETSSQLSRLLLRNPHFRTLYCCGYYDLACPLNATQFTVNHMGLDLETRSHISFAYYPAGHMMYIEKSSRIKLHDDVAKFVADTLAEKP